MDYAYLAGLLDGEGSITLLSPGRRVARRPVLSIGMADENVIDAVIEFAGGFKSTKRRPERKPMHYWTIKGGRALGTLGALRPHLVIERRAALADMLLYDPVITSSTERNKLAHNEMVFKRMRERNAKRRAEPWPARRKPIRHDDLSYLAGLLDGEGHLRPTLQTEVASTDPEVLCWCRDRFGGNIYLNRPARGRQRAVWSWRRAPTGFPEAAGVASRMLVERKASRLRAAHGFSRTPAPGVAGTPHPADETYKRLRAGGFNVTAAANISTLPLARARKLG